MKLMYTETDSQRLDTTLLLRNKGLGKFWNAQVEVSLRKICQYRQNVPQHFHHLDNLVILFVMHTCN